MNTIHSVSNTSLVHSSEAVAVRNSFSFRSFMIRVMLVIAIVAGGKVAWGQDLELTFSFTSNPGGWPTADSPGGNYTYTISSANYTFALGTNVYYNSSHYLMLKSTTSLGLPAIPGYKLTKVVASNSSTCSTSTRVGVSSSSSSASYITGGAYQTWSTTSSSYTYNLTGTSANTMYYLYVTNKNAQITQLVLTYTSAAPSYTITAQSSDISLGTVSLSGTTITASPNDCVEYDSPAYFVISGNATVTQSENIFSVIPTSNCTVQINFAQKSTYEITWNVNGNPLDAEYCEDQTIPLGEIPIPTSSNCDGLKFFVGWTTDEITNELVSPPSPLYSGKDISENPVTSDENYYAVFAMGRAAIEQVYSFAGGGKEDLEATGAIGYGLGSDYAEANAPYRVKFDGTGDYIVIPCNNATPASLSIDVKMIGGSSSSTLEIQESTDGENYSNVQSFTVSGAQNAINSFTTTNEFSSGTHYVRIYYTKGSNIGVGPISINGHRYANYSTSCTPEGKVSITYDDNGATSGTAPIDSDSPYDIDDVVIVCGNTGNLEKTGYTFSGWNTAYDGSGITYTAGQTFTITENTILYAKWVINQYTIAWLANGQLINSKDYSYNSNISVDDVPEDLSITSAMCDGSKVFLGWSETEFEEPPTTPVIITYEKFNNIIVTRDKNYYAVFADDGGIEVIYSFSGGSKSGLGDGVATHGLGTDYADSYFPYQVKFDDTGDYIIIPCSSTPESLTFDVKMVGGSLSSTFTIQESTDDGSSFSDVQSFVTIGSQNTTLSFTTTNAFTPGTTKVKIYFDKGSNVGVGPITISGYIYSNYTTFCPCDYGTITGIANGDMFWAGKSELTNDWGNASSWAIYHTSDSKYHLAGSAPNDETNVYIIEKGTVCGITAEPTLSEDVECNNILLNGLNLNIAENHTLTINGDATFTSGIINGNVVFGEDATVSGVSTNSYVDGKVTKEGAANSTDFFFPTGSNGNLGKVDVSSDVSGVSVQYYSNPAGFSSNDLPRWWASASVSGFDHVSNVEYWRISSPEAITANFVAEASTDMHFNSETEDEDKIPTNIQMAFYDNNRWTNVGGSASIEGNTLSITDAEIPASATRGISGNYTTFGSKSKSSVLPIELVSFTAICNGRSSLIEWTTATEKNNDFFVLERSADAVNFKEIARIAGAGNSIEPISYAYTDFGVRNGDNYYRLVQVDYDGTSTASEIIVANCLGTDGEPEVLAYPNPFGDDLTLRFENFGNIQATVEVYDMLGRMVHTQKVNCSQNDYEVVLRLAGLSDGTYNVRISTADFVINRKVVKE